MRQGLEEALSAADYLRQDPDEGQRHARKLMALMAELLGGALLVEEAAWALERGNGRKALIARWYVERHFAPPPRRGIGPDQDWAQQQFDAIANYARVARASA